MSEYQSTPSMSWGASYRPPTRHPFATIIGPENEQWLLQGNPVVMIDGQYVDIVNLLRELRFMMYAPDGPKYKQAIANLNETEE